MIPQPAVNLCTVLLSCKCALQTFSPPLIHNRPPKAPRFVFLIAFSTGSCSSWFYILEASLCTFNVNNNLPVGLLSSKYIYCINSLITITDSMIFLSDDDYYCNASSEFTHMSFLHLLGCKRILQQG